MPPAMNPCESPYRQRRRSVQVTGIVVVPRGATRMEMFTIRFCFAPRNSSPSSSNTGSSEAFSTSKLPTTPNTETSEIVRLPSARASWAST